MKRALVFGFALGTVACGDDTGGTGTATMPTSASASSTGTPGTSTGDVEDTSSSEGGGSSSDGGSTTDPGSSTGGAGSTTTGGGAASDPEYPMPDGGTCPQGTAPVDFPGGSICAPFCMDAGSVCPAAATGDAAGTCTPFFGAGGSGDVCTDDPECPAGEGCPDTMMCTTIAFWSCALICSGGETCPDGMVCSDGSFCAYPA